MGGVFDPIHYGHLFTAEEARIEFKLDEVIFVPCREPVHKRENSISAPEHRYLMTVLAISNNPFFEVSKIELNRPGPSYSIDTVKEFLRKYNYENYFTFIDCCDGCLISTRIPIRLSRSVCADDIVVVCLCQFEN